jgi:hypothetical protein
MGICCMQLFHLANNAMHQALLAAPIRNGEQSFLTQKAGKIQIAVPANQFNGKLIRQADLFRPGKRINREPIKLGLPGAYAELKPGLVGGESVK